VYASAGAGVSHPDESYDGRTPDIPDNAFVLADFASGARAALDLCMFGEGARWQNLISVADDCGRIDARMPAPGRFAASGRERASRQEIMCRKSRRRIREICRSRLRRRPPVIAAGPPSGSAGGFATRFRGGQARRKSGWRTGCGR